MSYSALSDITARIDEGTLTQLTDDEGLGVINEARVTAAITEADSEIDSYLSTRYTVPLATTPEVVKALSVTIAIWNLYGRRGLVDEMRETRYKAAVDLLKQISKGAATLGVDPEPSEGGQQIKVNREKGDKQFSIATDSTDETGTLDNY